MKKGLLLFLGAFLMFTDQIIAQDAEFSQFYANPMYLNPAFAGTNRCPRVVLNYRNQWPGIANSFVTYSASYDQHVDLLHGGLGVMVVTDKAGEGALRTTNVSAVYSYQMNLNRKFSLKAGAQATWFQKSIDPSKLTFGDMIDPRRGYIYESNESISTSSVSNVDFSAGLLLFSKRFYMGFATHHLTQPGDGFSGNNNLPMKMTAHAGAVLSVNEEQNISISPNILWRRQGMAEQINLGMYVSSGPITGGLWYRMGITDFYSDAVIALVGFQYKIFKIGYSYDFTISPLKNLSYSGTKGAHEVSLSTQFFCKPKKKKFKTFKCPTF